MADIKISQLPEAEPLTGNELVPVVQDMGDGTLETRKATASGFGGLFVRLFSAITQIISSNLALSKGSKLLGVKNDGTQGNLVSVGDYPDGSGGTYEQVEVGTENDPLCLNHNTKAQNGSVVGKNILVNYRDENGVSQTDAVAYISDISKIGNKYVAYTSDNGNDSTGVVGDKAFPFKTLAAAADAALKSNSRTYVDVGQYCSSYAELPNKQGILLTRQSTVMCTIDGLRYDYVPWQQNMQPTYGYCCGISIFNATLYVLTSNGLYPVTSVTRGNIALGSPVWTGTVHPNAYNTSNNYGTTPFFTTNATNNSTAVMQWYDNADNLLYITNGASGVQTLNLQALRNTLTSWAIQNIDASVNGLMPAVYFSSPTQLSIFISFYANNNGESSSSGGESFYGDNYMNHGTCNPDGSNVSLVQSWYNTLYYPISTYNNLYYPRWCTYGYIGQNNQIQNQIGLVTDYGDMFSFGGSSDYNLWYYGYYNGSIDGEEGSYYFYGGFANPYDNTGKFGVYIQLQNETTYVLFQNGKQIGAAAQVIVDTTNGGELTMDFGNAPLYNYYSLPKRLQLQTLPQQTITIMPSSYYYDTVTLPAIAGKWIVHISSNTSYFNLAAMNTTVAINGGGTSTGGVGTLACYNSTVTLDYQLNSVNAENSKVVANRPQYSLTATNSILNLQIVSQYGPPANGAYTYALNARNCHISGQTIYLNGNEYYQNALPANYRLENCKVDQDIIICNGNNTQSLGLIATNCTLRALRKLSAGLKSDAKIILQGNTLTQGLTGTLPNWNAAGISFVGNVYNLGFDTVNAYTTMYNAGNIKGVTY